MESIRLETIRLETSDGHTLAADVAAPPGDTRGAVAVCHPHPAYGGDRFNTMVAALFEALPAAGFVTLRFDFRAGGGGEHADLQAALDAVAARTGGPLALAGYSFGAAVALATTDRRVTAIAAVAPPLTMMQVPVPTVPALVLTPAHDQFCPPGQAGAIVAGWPTGEFDEITGCDHFLVGHTAAIAQRVAEWLATLC
ncbi:MAG TPA: hypothetical protein VIS05_00155 [Ilumatobacter sp.]